MQVKELVEHFLADLVDVELCAGAGRGGGAGAGGALLDTVRVLG